MSNSDKLNINELGITDITADKINCESVKDSTEESCFSTLGIIIIKRYEDTSAPNSSIYYSTDQSALCYKNEAGAIFTIDVTAT